MADKMVYANRADPGQTTPSSLIRVYAVCYSTKYVKKQLHKNKT